MTINPLVENHYTIVKNSMSNTNVVWKMDTFGLPQLNDLGTLNIVDGYNPNVKPLQQMNPNTIVPQKKGNITRNMAFEQEVNKAIFTVTGTVLTMVSLLIAINM